MRTFDIAVIGTGPAGHHAAIQAAKLGKRVVAIECDDAIGGVCMNLGTIPSKTLREAVLYLTGFRQRGIYGLGYTLKSNITIKDLMFRCEQVTKNEIDVLVAQFGRNHVEIIGGSASFLDPNHLRITSSHSGDEDIEVGHVVIATGSTPAHTPTVPINGTSIIDSDGIFQMTTIPKTMTIVGAGIVGIEYACVFAALGSEVTVVDKRSKILEFVDQEVLEALMYHMREEGVVFRFNEEVTEVADTGGRVVARTKSNKSISAECLVYTVGRQGNTQSLCLENAGLAVDDRGRINVNDFYQTKQPNIYACGDVIGFPALASTAMEQGRLASGHAFGLHHNAINKYIPIGLYTIPEISMVGRTEEQLTEQAVPYEFGIARYREIARGQIIGDRSGMLKMLVHCETREVLGVHILGEGATELIHIGQAAIALGGTLDYFVGNVFNYPTLAECYKVAALDAYNKLN